MTDFNRHAFPAGGGWKFRQPQTNWINPYAMVGFDASVKAIIQHRKANKAITVKHNLSTDYDEVAAELEGFNRLRLGIPDPGNPSFFQRSRSRLPSEGAAAAGNNWFRRFSRLGTGVTTIGALIASGKKPVEEPVAEQRAAICVACPKNIQGDFFSIFTKPIAMLIRSQIEDKRVRKLRTSLDDKLGTCDACGCPMELKVHFPLDIIREHIKKPELDQLDPSCWILREG